MTSAAQCSRRAALLLCAAALLLGWSVLAAPTAFAHAVLVGSTPVDGSRVQTSPTQVRLDFDEHIQLVPGAAKVISVAGTSVDAAPAHLSSSGTSVVIPIKPHLARGSYTATWRVVSADTHIVSGSITFGVRQAAAATSAEPTTHLSDLDVVSDVGQGATYLGAALAFGTVAVCVLLWPDALSGRRHRMLGGAGWAMLVLGSLAELLLAGPRALDTGWSGVVRLNDIGQTLHTEYGVALVVRLALLAALPAALGHLRSRPTQTDGAEDRVPMTTADFGSRWRTACAAVGAVGVLVTIAMGGHAAVGSDRYLALFATTVHLAAMAVWLGGLATLAVQVLPALREVGPMDLRTLQGWSVTAYSCVAILVVTGEYQSWRQLHPVASLWHTAYGITLVVKLALLAITLGAAFTAQRALLRRALADSATAVRTVRRSVRIESVLVITILAVTTVLVSQPPAKTSFGPATQLTAPLGPDRLVVKIESTRRGPQQISLTAVDDSGRPVRLQSLTGSLSSPAAGIAALDLKLVRGPGLRWHSVAAVAPKPGRWSINLDASTSTAVGYATTATYTVW